MKKVNIAVIVLFFLGIILSACGAGDSMDDKQNGPVTITFATFLEEGAQADAYKDIINKFEEANDGIKVVLESGAAGYEDKIKKSLEEGRGPDVIGLQRPIMLEYAKQDKLMDLTDWVQSSGLKDKLYGVSSGYGKVENRYYGIGDLPYTVEWFYNPDLFKKAGVSEPKTLDELISICGKMKNYTRSPITIGAKDPWAMDIFFGLIAVQTIGADSLGTAFYNGSREGYINLSGGQDAVDVLSRMVKSGAINKGVTENAYPDSVNDFVKGKAAILPMGSWAVEKIVAMKSQSFSYKVFDDPVTLVSNPESMVSATAIQVITVNKNTQNTEAVMKFMDYLFSQEAQSIFASANGISSLKSANSRSDDEFKNLVLKHLDKTDENSTMYIDNVSDKMADVTGDNLVKMINGDLRQAETWNMIVNETFAN